MPATVSDQLPLHDLSPTPDPEVSRIQLVFGPATIARRSFQHNGRSVSELQFRMASGKRLICWTQTPPDAAEVRGQPNPFIMAEFNPAILSAEDDARDMCRNEFDRKYPDPPETAGSRDWLPGARKASDD